MKDSDQLKEETFFVTEVLFLQDKTIQQRDVVLNGKTSSISYQQFSGVPTLHVAVKQKKG